MPVAPDTCSFCTTTNFKRGVRVTQQQDIITLLGMDETAEWGKSFVLVPKSKGKVRIYLDLARLNQVLI